MGCSCKKSKKRRLVVKKATTVKPVKKPKLLFGTY